MYLNYSQMRIGSKSRRSKKKKIAHFKIKLIYRRQK